MTENIRNGSVRMHRGNVQKSLLALSMEQPEPGRPERGLHACVSTSHEAPLGPAVCHQYGFSADESSPILCALPTAEISLQHFSRFSRVLYHEPGVRSRVDDEGTDYPRHHHSHSR